MPIIITGQLSIDFLQEDLVGCCQLLLDVQLFPESPVFYEEESKGKDIGVRSYITHCQKGINHFFTNEGDYQPRGLF